MKSKKQGCVIENPPSGGNSKDLCKNNKEIAEMLGLSLRVVERYKTVIHSGNDEILEAIKAGKMTINTAYNIIVNAKKAPPEISEKVKTTLDIIDFMELSSKEKKELSNILKARA